ncbi:hypothetical protein ACFLTD_03765 [Elusimicrobiota bacterium]
MNNNDKRKRKKYLIDVKFQSKFITMVIILILCSIVVSGMLTYAFTIFHESTTDYTLYGATQGQPNKMVMISSMFVIKPILIRSLFTSAVLSSLIAFFLMLFYSHSLAGPVYHMEQHIEDIISGNYDRTLRFRKDDEFKQLADTINRLQNELKKNQVT